MSRLFRTSPILSRTHKTSDVTVVRVLFVVFALALFVATFAIYPYTRDAGTRTAKAATNSTLNFQARILTSGGAVVSDGSYNIRFKIYTGGTSGGPGGIGAANAGTLLWTETWQNSNSQGIVTKNGYISAALGSITAFSGINWDQELWVTMDVGGTSVGASPTYDGEMLQTGNKRMKVTGVPYALAAGTLQTTNGAGTLSSTLAINTPTVGNQTFQIPDQAAAGTYTICIQNATGCGFLKRGTADTSSGAAGAGYLYGFTNSSSALTGGVLQLDNGTNTGNTLYVASSGNPAAGKALIVANAATGVTGNLIDLQLNAVSKFSVNQAGNVIAAGTITSGAVNGLTLTSAADGFTIAGGTTSRTLTVTGASITIGSTITPTAAGALSVTSNGANALTLDSGGAANVNIGTGAASKTIQIGTTAVNTGNTQAIGIGNTAAAGTTNVTIGATTGATGGTTTIQSLGTLALGNSISPTVTLQSTVGGTINLGTATTTGTISLGGTSTSGTITLGQSSGVNNTINIGANIANTFTQTINIGTSATGTTNTTIGSATAGTTILQGTTRLSALTTNGFVKTTGANGTLAVSTTVALGSEVSGILGAANGGTGNGFTAFSGPTTATKTFALPDVSTTICTTNSVCAGYAPSATNGYVQLAPASIQADSTTNTSIFLNKTGASGSLLDLRNNNTSIFSLGYSGALTVLPVQPAALAANGTSQGTTVNFNGGIGGNTTGTTGQTAGQGGNLFFSGGNGGTAGVGSTNGRGGDITLQGGTAGAGAGGANFSGNVLLQPNTGFSVGVGTPTPANQFSVNALTTADANYRVAISTRATTDKGLLVQGILNQSGDLFQAQTSTGATLASIGATGATAFKNSVDSSSAFQIQTAAGVNAVNLNNTYDTNNLFSANPSFEVNTNGWAAEAAGGSIARTTTAGQFYYGDAGGVVTTTTTAGTGVRYNLTLTDATVYNLTIPIKGATAFSTLQIGYASTGLVGSEGTAGQNCTALNVTTGWSFVSCTITTTTHSGTPYIYIKQTDAGTARTFYIDGVILAPAAFGNLGFTESHLSLQDTTLAINTTTDTQAALTIQQRISQGGLLLKGSGEVNIFQQPLLDVQSSSGSPLLRVLDTVNTVRATGGSSLYHSAAFTSVSGSDGFQSLNVYGNSATQTADLLRVQKNAGATTGLVVTAAGRLGIGTPVVNTNDVSTVNYDLAFGQGADRTIGVETQLTAATAGNNLTISSGQGNTTGAGGNIALQAGGSGTGATGNGGGITLTAGTALSTDGNGGDITLVAGAKSGTGTGGKIVVKPGTLGNRIDFFQFQNQGGFQVANVDTQNNIFNFGQGSLIDGKIRFYNASSGNFVTMDASTAAASYVLRLPTTAGAASDCLKNSGTAGVLTFGSCAAASSLQSAYDADVDGSDTVIALTAADDSLILRNPAAGGTDSTYILTLDQLATTAKGGLSVQSAGTGNLLLVTDTTATARDVLTIADGGATTFRNQTNTGAAFQVQNAAGSSIINVGSSTPQFTLSDGAVAGAGNLVLTTNVASGEDAGDVIFNNNAGTQKARIWSSSAAGVSGLFLSSGDLTADISIDNSGNTTIASNLTANGSSLFKNGADSTTAFQIQNAAGANILNVNTTAGNLLINGVVPATFTGSVATSLTPFAIEKVGDLIYVVGAANNLQIFDASNPALVTLKTTFAVTGASALESVVVRGNYAYISDFTATKFFIVDISNTNAPVLVKTVTTASSIVDLNVYGNYAYLFTNANTIVIYDITNPNNPVLKSTTATSITTFSGASGIVVKGSYLYISGTNGTNGKLYIYDISNPSLPVLKNGAGATTNSTSPAGMSVVGSYAYIYNRTLTASLEIFDISNATTTAAHVGTVNLTAGGTIAGWGPSSVSVQGNRAYVTNNSANRLEIIDISAVTAPTISGSVSTDTRPAGVKVDGLYAYVLTYTSATIKTYNIGGAYAQTLEAGNLNVTDLQVGNSATFNANASIFGSLNVGQNLQVNEDLGVAGNAKFQNTANNTNAFKIQNTAGANLINVDTISNNNNLITNPSAEVDTSGWNTNAPRTGTAISRTTTAANVYYGVGAIDANVTTGSVNSGVNYPITLTAGVAYNATVMMKLTTNGNVTFGYAHNGTEGTYQNNACYGGNAGTGWYICSLTFTPATVSGSPYFFIKQNDSVVRHIYIDGLFIAPVAGWTGGYQEGQINLGNSATPVYVGGSPSNPIVNGIGTLFVQQVRDKAGLQVRGTPENDLLRQPILNVETSGQFSLLNVNEAQAVTQIQGGSAFWGSAALRVLSNDAGATALRVMAAPSQTGNVFEVTDNSGTDMFTVGSAGSTLVKTLTNSTTAFQVQNLGGTAALTVDTTTNDTTLSGDLSIGSGGTLGQVIFNNGTANLLSYPNVGVAAPTFTTRSAGTKILLYNGLTGSATDYAIGIANNTLWNSVPASTNQFAWYVGTTAVATLNGSGWFNVAGTGTANDAPLHIQNSGNAWTTATWKKSIRLDGGANAIEFSAGTANPTGIGGTTNGVYIWEAAGETGASGLTYVMRASSSLGFSAYIANGAGATAVCASSTVAGNRTFTAAATVCTNPSSIRLKENVTDMSDALNILGQLRPVAFNWKASTGITAINGGSADYGFIAEEVNNVIPELVSRDENGQIQGLNYSGFVPFLARAIQQQQAEITALQGNAAGITGGGTVNGNLAITGSLNVTGPTTLDGGLTVNGNAVFNGNLTVQNIQVANITINGHIITAGNAPTAAVETAAGIADTQNNIAAPVVTIDGNDTAGSITIVAGASTTAGDMANVTFTTTFGKAPRIILTPVGSDSAKLQTYVNGTSAAGFKLGTNVAPAAGTTYTYNYQIMQ